MRLANRDGQPTFLDSAITVALMTLFPAGLFALLTAEVSLTGRLRPADWVFDLAGLLVVCASVGGFVVYYFATRHLFAPVFWHIRRAFASASFLFSITCAGTLWGPLHWTGLLTSYMVTFALHCVGLRIARLRPALASRLAAAAALLLLVVFFAISVRI